MSDSTNRGLRTAAASLGLLGSLALPAAAFGGACCVPGNPGSCQAASAAQCALESGAFLGETAVCGVDLCPFVDPLPRLPVLQPVTGQAGGAATYEIAVTERTQRLHRDLPPTRLWTYAGTYPGPTIETRSGQPVRVTWVNDLRDESGTPRTTNLLPADACLHGVHPGDNTARFVTHLHGGHVPADSDGHPEESLVHGESDVYDYPNQQQPATLWYHDHTLGMTRLNVYLGLAGFYLLRDEFEDALGLPNADYEIPLLVQDRSFNADGSLSYPDAWHHHVFSDTIVVNGKVWPYLEVARGKYRLRLLNGSNSRTLRLALSDGSIFHQIGGDGGLLPAPVAVSQVTLTPAERADVVIDFAGYAAGQVLRLVNDAPAPFPGPPGAGVVADVLEFRVQSQAGHVVPLPAALRPIERLEPSTAVRTRSFELEQFYDPCAGSMWMINGLDWNQITEWPVLGTTEIWRFINYSGVVHPMHLHLVMFQVLDRQPFQVVDGKPQPIGEPVPAPAWEAGWKDTVAAYPFEITRVIARFTDYAGLFPYHCHVLEHEDHDMMRQFRTVEQPQDACLGGDLALCLDDETGDHRFWVDVQYQTSQAGGLAGAAHAVSLADKGMPRGGLFWFFESGNPELLVKILDGCGINGHYWVFVSAATNVGVTVTITDTVNGKRFVTTNPDLVPFASIQATGALPCTP